MSKLDLAIFVFGLPLVVWVLMAVVELYVQARRNFKGYRNR